MTDCGRTNLVLGTAGHIDHGKSSLILALTGTDPDRLIEEKKRGITIELGFAQLDLGDGRFMSVVDVPGHERFVRQMIAGATGIDIALLVIAADDGIMPQTLEHVAVLRTLSIPTCVVALTKIDLVDPEWVALVTDDVRSFLSNTPYAGSPIVPVSSRTQEGLENVRAALAQASTNANALHRESAMRQPVDRVFTIKGAGTVITGTLWSGAVHPGDTVQVLPSGRMCRVRSVQMHDNPTQEALAGNRVALNLVDIKTDEIRPGDFLTAPNLIEPTNRFDAHITYLDALSSGKPLEDGVRMHVAHGTKEVIGRVWFLDGLRKLAAGQSTFVQIRLEEPLPVSYGDRFILRTYSPVYVAGGGMVLQAHPLRRTVLYGEKPLLECLAESNMDGALSVLLENMRYPLTVSDLAWRFGIGKETAQSLLYDQINAQKVRKLGDNWYATQSVIKRALSAIEKELLAFHADNPSKTGLSKEELRQKCLPSIDALCFDALLLEAERAKVAVLVGGLVGHPHAQSAAQEAENAAAEVLMSLLAARDLMPPSLSELASETGLDISLTRRVLLRLREEGKVYRVSSELYYDAASVAKCKQAIAQLLHEGGSGTIAGLKEAMGGISRKYAVPLLEAFDDEGFTVREGDVRVLRKTDSAHN